MSFCKFIQLHNYLYNLALEHLYHSKKFPWTCLQSVSAPVPSPKQPLTLAVYLCFFWKFFVNGIFRHVLIVCLASFT